MYENYFGMTKTPFSRDLPPEALYESRAMGEALGRLAYVADRQLFAVVTADAECGKSTLIRKFAAALSKDDYILLYLSDSKLTPRWFYKGMLDQLGKETIEEFRFLLNYKFDSMSPMALILVGQSELWDDKLRLKRYAAVRQRIDINCVLAHLDRAETEKYIRSHLDYAGCRNELFTSRAVDEIYKSSAGIPRVINRICEKSLMYACQQEHKLIDEMEATFVVEHEMLDGGDVA